MCADASARPAAGQSLPSSAQQSQLSARTIVNRTRAYMSHAGGVRLHFHCKALGLYNYSGDMLIKDNKSMLISERHTVWNNGQVAWALDKAKNTVTISNPKNEQNNRIADQLAIVDNCDLTIARQATTGASRSNPARAWDSSIAAKCS